MTQLLDESTSGTVVLKTAVGDGVWELHGTVEVGIVQRILELVYAIKGCGWRDCTDAPQDAWAGCVSDDPICNFVFECSEQAECLDVLGLIFGLLPDDGPLCEPISGALFCIKQEDRGHIKQTNSWSRTKWATVEAGSEPGRDAVDDAAWVGGGTLACAGAGAAVGGSLPPGNAAAAAAGAAMGGGACLLGGALFMGACAFFGCYNEQIVYSYIWEYTPDWGNNGWVDADSGIDPTEASFSGGTIQMKPEATGYYGSAADPELRKEVHRAERTAAIADAKTFGYVSNDASVTVPFHLLTIAVDDLLTIHVDSTGVAVNSKQDGDAMVHLGYGGDATIQELEDFPFGLPIEWFLSFGADGQLATVEETTGLSA